YGYVQTSRLDQLGSYYLPFNLDQGRPIPGWIMGKVVPGATSVADLWQMRAVVVSVLALSGVAAALMVLVMTRTASSWTRYPAALVVGLTPMLLTASPSTATWAILMGAIHSYATAVVAGLMVGWRHRLWWLASGALLLVTAFSYQQVVTVAMLPAFLVTAADLAQRRTVRWWRPVVVGVMGVAALALNTVYILSRDGVGASRIGQGTWSERIDWYVHSFLPVAFDLHVPSTGDGAVWSLVLALALACTPLLLGLRHAVLPAAVVLATLASAAAVLPLEMWASYRVAAPTQFSLWVGVAACVAYTTAYVAWRAVAAVGVVGGAVLVALGLTTAHTRAVDYLAAPNARDWANVRCLMGDGKDFDPAKKWYTSPFSVSTSPVITTDEYGIVGSLVQWSLQAELWLAQDAVDGPGLPSWTGTNADVVQLVDPAEPDRELFPGDACAR
ncbi:hypothetical protein, partial [Nocardioides zeicaulis]